MEEVGQHGPLRHRGRLIVGRGSEDGNGGVLLKRLAPLQQQDAAGRHGVHPLNPHEELGRATGVRHARGPEVVRVPRRVAEVGDLPVFAGAVRPGIFPAVFADRQPRRLGGRGRARQERGCQRGEQAQAA